MNPIIIETTVTDKIQKNNNEKKRKVESGSRPTYFFIFVI